MFQKETIGIIGMGIMGRNLALNIESKGYNVAIYNRSKDKTDEVIANNPGKLLLPYYSMKDFILSLNKPRFIFLMITSGIFIDDLIKKLLLYLDKGDILIDGGNSFYQDTIRRNAELLNIGIHFIGIGISGGEKGALQGPSLMPGGTKDAYKLVAPVLKKIAASVNDEACVTYIGPNGSGHYVKMIHNGIEYGDMQLISEIYCFLKKMLQCTNTKLGEIFYLWNQGELSSYLIEITSCIFLKKNVYNQYILDSILDVAVNKGTGIWSVQSALNLGIPSSLIAESVFFRYLSALKNERIQASRVFLKPAEKMQCILDEVEWIEKARKALYLAKIILYAQGFYQLKIVSDKYCWDLNYKNIAKIFRAGCIIRAEFLQKIVDIYTQDSQIINLLLAPYCVDIANNYQEMLRDVVACGVLNGIPMPALSAAISYYDGLRSELLSTNLIQAQRDCFGAHTYMRVDKPGVFHTKWCEE